MRGLFRAFDREGVDCLLIGGQAAILSEGLPDRELL